MKRKSIVPARIIFLREQNKMKQQDLADRITVEGGFESNLHGCIISNWETGKRPVPMKYVPLLMSIFGVTEAYLFGLTNDPSKNTADNFSEVDPPTVEITYETLVKYHDLPIYVVFNNFQHDDAWGIYDKFSNTITFKDYVLKLSNPNDDNCSFFALHPSFSKFIAPEGFKMLDLSRVLQCPYVYVLINSPNKEIRAKYNGWYHHNEDGSCLINSIGLTLPYDGYGISYAAYADDEFISSQG